MVCNYSNGSVKTIPCDEYHPNRTNNSKIFFKCLNAACHCESKENRINMMKYLLETKNNLKEN